MIKYLNYLENYSFYCYRFCYMYPKCKPLHFSSRHFKSLLNLTSIHKCHHLQMMHLWITIRFPNEVKCNELNTSVISTRVTWALPTAIRFEKYCKKPGSIPLLSVVPYVSQSQTTVLQLPALKISLKNLLQFIYIVNFRWLHLFLNPKNQQKSSKKV